MPGRLRWRCRRGMRELDVLLSRWLERRWARSDPGTRQAFESLLERQDPELAAWLLGRDRPPQAEIARIVDEILSS